jgi:hypothetical protein
MAEFDVIFARKVHVTLGVTTAHHAERDYFGCG